MTFLQSLELYEFEHDHTHFPIDIGSPLHLFYHHALTQIMVSVMNLILAFFNNTKIMILPLSKPIINRTLKFNPISVLVLKAEMDSVHSCNYLRKETAKEKLLASHFGHRLSVNGLKVTFVSFILRLIITFLLYSYKNDLPSRVCLFTVEYIGIHCQLRFNKALLRQGVSDMR